MRREWGKHQSGAAAWACLCLMACDNPAGRVHSNGVPFHTQISLENSQAEFVEPPHSFSISDPLAHEQWSLNVTSPAEAHIHMPQNWDDFSFPQPTLVAVIDSGIELTHPDIDLNKMFENLGEVGTDADGLSKRTNGIDDDANGFIDDVRGWSFADNTATQTDALGHGTHVMGLLAAMHDNAEGIASPWRGLRILPIQIFSGKRPSATPSQIAEAIRYAVNMGSKVISASFGTPSFTPEILEAIRYAHENDVIFVSAVGNFRKNLNIEPNYPSDFGLPNQIAVAASDELGMASTFTNFGNTVDIFAPGKNIVSLATGAKYAKRSGTSQACPMVAATVAMMRALRPNLRAEQIKQQLLHGADEQNGLFAFAPKPLRLNVENALRGTVGNRLTQFDTQNWPTVVANIETEHPYRNATTQTFRVMAAPGTRRFQISFSKFETQSTDTVKVLDANSKILAVYSGPMKNFWTPVIEGEAATLVLTSDLFVSDWGFSIDKIRWENKEL